MQVRSATPWRDSQDEVAVGLRVDEDQPVWRVQAHILQRTNKSAKPEGKKRMAGHKDPPHPESVRRMAGQMPADHPHSTAQKALRSPWTHAIARSAAQQGDRPQHLGQGLALEHDAVADVGAREEHGVGLVAAGEGVDDGDEAAAGALDHRAAGGGHVGVLLHRGGPGLVDQGALRVVRAQVAVLARQPGAPQPSARKVGRRGLLCAGVCAP